MTGMVSKYIAVSSGEFQETLKEELSSLGASDIEDGYKAVSFYADKKTAYSIHLKTATASKIMEVFREGAAKDRRAIFFQALKVKWAHLFRPNATYLVEGIAGDRGKDAPSKNDISKVVREAIEANFAYEKKKKPQVDLKDPDIHVVAFYYRKRITISILTSGKSMHKRGYKSDRHPAPVKEHVAHSLLKMAGYDGSQTLFDPMCGSGTFAIEAAYIALQKGVLIHRKKGDFGLERLSHFDRDMWRLVQEDVRGERKESPHKPIFAGDIEKRYVDMSQRHALKARVERYITFQQRDFFTTKAPDSSGLLVVNLPYGERLSDKDEDLMAFYKAFGDRLKKEYSGWTCAVLAADSSPWKQIGLRPYRRVQVRNGGIDCRFLLYRLYDGSLKSKYL